LVAKIGNSFEIPHPLIRTTLWRTLGCLLEAQLGIQLRRVSSGHRYTFTNPGEQLLDRWMDQYAFVT
jgi:hypothetical protein